MTPTPACSGCACSIEGGPRTLLWTTAHLSYSGNAVEVETGVNQRTPQARRVVEELDRLGRPDEPVFLATDTNAIATAIWVIGNAGYLDSFTALNRQAPPTHPVIPNPFASSRRHGEVADRQPPEDHRLHLLPRTGALPQRRGRRVLRPRDRAQ